MSDKKEKSPAGTVVDYLRWRGDLTLQQSDFNEVDNLALCILSYLNYARFPALGTMDPAAAVPLRDLAPQMGPEDEQLGLSELSYLPVMTLCGASRRFEEARLFGYVSESSDEQETQFQAVSFLLPDDTLFIAYMGTDRSMAGWKEDFNMSFLSAVPAQEKALAYALSVLEAVPGRKVRIGGHSKGGNLAAWTAIHLPAAVQDERLLAVYNNDGPGFYRELWDSDGCRNMAEKLHTFIPECSIVGILLDYDQDHTVIGSVNRSVLQHEAMSWLCLGSRFVRVPRRSEMARHSDAVIREWLGALTPAERQEFCDSLFEIFSQGGKVKMLDELKPLRAYASADEEKKKVLDQAFGRLAADIRDELLAAAGEGISDMRRAAEAGISDAKKVWNDLKNKKKER